MIAVAPNDPDQIAPVLKKSRDRGIGVLTFDADAAPDARDFFVNQATYTDIGVTLMDIMAEAIGPEGKYIILTGSLTAANQVLWIREMEKHRQAKYPKMVNLSELPKPTEEDQALATRVATDVLKSYPDVQGMFGMTSVALPGAAEALRTQKAADRVYLTGLSTPKGMRSYVHDDTVKKFVLWNAVDLGYLTVHAAKLFKEGKLTDGTIQAGRLGEITVRDGEVLLGKPVTFDKSNVDAFDF
jgi:ABC-type sugar transport system substrate-binding protein